MPLDQPVVQEDWQSPALLNSWVNFGSVYNPVGYWRDSVGVVHLRGVIRSGTFRATIFTLPAGYRPALEEAQLTWCISSAMGYQVARVDISAAGEVICVQAASSGTTTALFLDGMTFRAA